MLRGFGILALCAALSAPADAGELDVVVKMTDGMPLPDAVVTLPAPAGAKPSFPWKMEIAQKDKEFSPFVLIVPQGAEVAFPNLDKFRHHVYSFSKGNKFELELYGKDETRRVAFKAPGTAALGCNIHDNMVAFVRVVDTPYAAKSDTSGMAAIKNAPAGKVTVTVWHPYARAKEQVTTATAIIAADGATRIDVTLDVAAPSHRH
jgi:plastocyanin